MDAKELRIGNYVFDDENNICSIEKIVPNNFFEFCYVCNTDSGKIYPSNIYKIQITEELLLKLEARQTKSEQINYYAFDIEDDMCIYINYRNGKIFESGIAMYGYCSEFEYNTELFKPIELKYVHTLQNLYFSLKGKELTIKKE